MYWCFCFWCLLFFLKSYLLPTIESNMLHVFCVALFLKKKKCKIKLINSLPLLPYTLDWWITCGRTLWRLHTNLWFWNAILFWNTGIKCTLGWAIPFAIHTPYGRFWNSNQNQVVQSFQIQTTIRWLMFQIQTK